MCLYMSFYLSSITRQLSIVSCANIGEPGRSHWWLPLPMPLLCSSNHSSRDVLVIGWCLATLIVGWFYFSLYWWNLVGAELNYNLMPLYGLLPLLLGVPFLVLACNCLQLLQLECQLLIDFSAMLLKLRYLCRMLVRIQVYKLAVIHSHVGVEDLTWVFGEKWRVWVT